MKLTITEIKKANEPWTSPKNDKYPKPITIYSAWCVCEVDNEKDIQCKVQAFTEKIELKVGAEFESEKNCGHIKRELKTNKNGEAFTQYSIYAKKSDFQKPGGGYNKKTMSEADLVRAIEFSKHQMKFQAVFTSETAQMSFFATIFIGYTNNVDPTKEKVEL